MKPPLRHLTRVLFVSGIGVALVLGNAFPAAAATPKDFSFYNGEPEVATATVKAAGNTYRINAVATSNKETSLKQNYISGAGIYTSYRLTLTDSKKHTLLAVSKRDYRQALYAMSRFLKQATFPKVAPSTMDQRVFWTSGDKFDPVRSTFISKAQLLATAKQAFGVSAATAKTYWQRQIRLGTMADELQYWASKTYAEVSKLSASDALDYLNRDEELTMPNYRGSVSILGTTANDWLITVENNTDGQAYTFSIENRRTYVSHL